MVNPVDSASGTDKYNPTWASARAGQGSSLVYYGAYWDGGISKWKHSFRLATGARGVAYNPDDPNQIENPPVFRKQRYHIDPEASDIGVDVETDPDHYGIAPGPASNQGLESVAETVIGIALGAINPWLGAGYKLGDLVYELGAPALSNEPDGFEYIEDYESGWSDFTGVNWASHYHHFHLNQNACTSIRGCQGEPGSITTVTAEMIGCKHYGAVTHDTQVEFEVNTSPGDDDDGSVSAFHDPDVSIHPEEMSDATKEKLGVEPISAVAGTPRNEEITYYASDFPITIKSK